MSDTSPSFGRAPSATTMMLKWAPNSSRSLIDFATTLTSYGISGMRMASAPPPRPAYRAIQPA